MPSHIHPIFQTSITAQAEAKIFLKKAKPYVEV